MKNLIFGQMAFLDLVVWLKIPKTPKQAKLQST